MRKTPYYALILLVLVIAATVAAVEISYGTATSAVSSSLSSSSTTTMSESSFTSISGTSYSSQTSLAGANVSDCNQTETQVLSDFGDFASVPSSILSTFDPLHSCQSVTNLGYLVYPVILMNINATGYIRALYSQILSNYPTNTSYPQVYELPYLEATNATIFTAALPFNLSSSFEITNATLVWKDNTTIEYQYTVRSLANSTGYYMFTLPGACGIFETPFVVGIKNTSLSGNYLDELGYQGLVLCGASMPGIIVGVSNMSVSYVLLPEWE